MANFVGETGFLGTLTFDVGSVTTRAGFAGDDAPRALYPSAVCEAVDGTGAEVQGVLERENDARLGGAALRSLGVRKARARGGEMDEAVFLALLEHGMSFHESELEK